ncbi:hypothetical protein, partial [Paludibacterium sp.]|uniref:hypothetical protein n=1 Tax=Paludibacterium sp. TaxID=1917523 RepID=UPI0025D56CEB
KDHDRSASYRLRERSSEQVSSRIPQTSALSAHALAEVFLLALLLPFFERRRTRWRGSTNPSAGGGGTTRQPRVSDLHGVPV